MKEFYVFDTLGNGTSDILSGHRVVANVTDWTSRDEVCGILQKEFTTLQAENERLRQRNAELEADVDGLNLALLSQEMLNDELEIVLDIANKRVSELEASVKDLLDIANIASAHMPGELAEYPERVTSAIQKAEKLLPSANVTTSER